MSDTALPIYHMKKNNVRFGELKSWEKKILECVGKHNCVVRAGGKWWRAGGSDAFCNSGAYRIHEDYIGEDADIAPLFIFMSDKDAEKRNEQYSFDPDGLESGLENWTPIQSLGTWEELFHSDEKDGDGDALFAGFAESNKALPGIIEHVNECEKRQLEKKRTETEKAMARIIHNDKESIDNKENTLKEMIEMMKQNRVRTNLLTDLEKAALEFAKKENCEIRLTEGWRYASTDVSSFAPGAIYRIINDYVCEKKKKLVSYDVVERNGEYLFFNPNANLHGMYIDCAERIVGFERIEYYPVIGEDGCLDNSATKPVRVWFWENE